MPLYDYSCSDCGTFEAKARYQDEEIECACGKQATRLSVYAVNFSGYARPSVDQRQIKMGDFHEASAELDHQHSKQTNIDGSPTPPPPLWKMAKREAGRLQKLGVKDSLDVKAGY